VRKRRQSRPRPKRTQTKSASLQITVNPYLQIPFQTLASGSVGTRYGQTVALAGDLAFPLLLTPERAPKQPSFDGELMAGFHWTSCAETTANANIGKTEGPTG
jgi:hypothetical protein